LCPLCAASERGGVGMEGEGALDVAEAAGGEDEGADGEGEGGDGPALLTGISRAE
jgi:hypothetical protein